MCVKRLFKRALAVLLTVSLLLGISATPASAGTWATYPGSGPQFKNADGWALQSFTVNKQKHPVLVHTHFPGMVFLTNLWKRGSETVDNAWTLGLPPIDVPPGTFTWKIADESIARLEMFDGIESVVHVIGLRAGKGPHPAL